MIAQQKTNILLAKIVKVCGLVLLFFLMARCQANPTPSPTSAPSNPVIEARLKPNDETELLDRLLETGVLKVGIRVWPEADFSPPAFRGISNAATGGALNGFEVDLARLLAQELGLELQLVEAYPPVISGGVWQGQWDIAIASLVPFDQPVANTAAAEIVYSTPYGYMPMGFLAASNNKFETVSQLAGQRVGVFEHSAYQRLLTPAEWPLSIGGQPIMTVPPTELRLIVLSNVQQTIRQLGQPISGTEAPVDVIFGPIPMLEQAIRTDLPVNLALNGESVGNQPLAVAIMPQDGLKVDRLLAKINTILEQAQRQGILSEIYFNWYKQDLSQPPEK